LVYTDFNTKQILSAKENAMYDSSFPPPEVPPPPPPSEMPKHSKLGIISFVLAIVSLVLVCLFFVFAYMLGSNNLSSGTGTTTIGWVFICLIGLSNLTGVGLGIAALTQKTQSKVFGILGLVFNALILLGFCIFILFAIVLAAGSL
jgi:hypothetical protein